VTQGRKGGAPSGVSSSKQLEIEYEVGLDKAEKVCPKRVFREKESPKKREGRKEGGETQKIPGTFAFTIVLGPTGGGNWENVLKKTGAP